MLLKNPPGISASCLVCVRERYEIFTSIFPHCELQNNTCSTEKFSITEYKQFYLLFPRKVGSYVVLKLENAQSYFLRVSRTTSAKTPMHQRLISRLFLHGGKIRAGVREFFAPRIRHVCTIVSILSLKASPISLKFKNA